MGCCFYEPLESYALAQQLIEIVYEDGRKNSVYAFKKRQMGIPIYEFAKLENCFDNRIADVNDIMKIEGVNKYKYEAVLERSQKYGDIVIDDFRLFGDYLKEQCKKCGSNLIYYDFYDGKFCPECNEWTEKKCSDPFCLFCPHRPERPLPVK